MDVDADRTPSLLQRCWVVDGKQPSGKIKVLYDSAARKLLDEVGLSFLDAANKSEWHNITRPEAPAAQARAASGSRFSAGISPSCRPTALCCHQRGCIIHITSSWRLGSGVGNMQNLSLGET
jgi:hypothetical protein